MYLKHLEDSGIDSSRDGVPSECRKREAYDKPGVRRRAAKKEGIKNSQKRNRANNRDY